MLQHYKICGGVHGVFENMGRGIISFRPGMLREGFLAEACPQLNLQAKIGINQANEKKALRQKKQLEKDRKEKAITLGEEQIGQCGKHYTELGLKTTHFP